MAAVMPAARLVDGEWCVRMRALAVSCYVSTTRVAAVDICYLLRQNGIYSQRHIMAFVGCGSMSHVSQTATSGAVGSN